MIFINVMTKQLRMRVHQRRYKERHLERLHELQRARYAADPDKYRKHNHDWCVANKEKVNERQRARYAANPEQCREADRLWQKAHPELIRARRHRRKARKLGNGGSWTVKEWLTLKRQYGFRCVACWNFETELTTIGRKLVPDHIVPLVKGGLNDITNLQPLCHGRDGWNNRKGAKFHDFVVS